MKVPFIDLKEQYESIRGEVASAIQDVLNKTAFAGGPFVEQFEQEFAQFCQTQHAVGVGSGTDALWLALWGLGVGPGDEGRFSLRQASIFRVRDGRPSSPAQSAKQSVQSRHAQHSWHISSQRRA